MSQSETVQPPVPVYPHPVPSQPKRVSPAIIVLAIAIIVLAVSTGYFYYQLQQTNRLVHDQINFSSTCNGTWNTAFTVLTETCTYTNGDVCTFTETINGQADTSTTTCRSP